MNFHQDADILAIKQRFEIVGNSPKLNHALRTAMQVAPTEMSVLISGESGSGKESFSKIIHSLSHRKHGQFIAVNCGAIPEGTIDSELFGHEKGAFTGATNERKGYFEVTNGGTIFLDEIGEMPMGTQARLLRVLENGEFIRVGSSKVQKTNVRVIAATNIDLIHAIGNKKFREDLYYRLSTVPIYVPALRERGEDVLLLFKKFSFSFSEKYKTTPIVLDSEAEKKLLKQKFPGNIRQFKNLIEQISLLSPSKDISIEILENFLPKSTPQLPTLISKNQSFDSFSERDILYKLLFDLKDDVNELKKLVFKILNNNSRNEILEEHKDLLNLKGNTSDSSGVPKYFDSEKFQEREKVPTLIISEKDNDPYEDKYTEINDTEKESLSIIEKEKELIEKALLKTNNKRKYAAKELGISERTLYRKIKQYNIE